MGLGFCILLSCIYGVKENAMFALYMLLTATKMRTKGWNSHLGKNEGVDS